MISRKPNKWDLVSEKLENLNGWKLGYFLWGRMKDPDSNALTGHT